jgi:hypothetical protein
VRSTNKENTHTASFGRLLLPLPQDKLFSASSCSQPRQSVPFPYGKRPSFSPQYNNNLIQFIYLSARQQPDKANYSQALKQQHRIKYNILKSTGALQMKK